MKLTYIIPIVLLIATSSCKKFLEVEPRASISDEATITYPDVRERVFNANAPIELYSLTDGAEFRWDG